MDTEKLDRSAKIFLAGLVFLFLYGMTAGIFSGPIAADTYERFTGLKASEADPVYMELLVHHTRMIGLMGAGLVVLTFYALWTGFRKGDKWALIAIVGGGGLGLGSLMGIHMAIKAWPLFIADNLGMTPIGMALSKAIREFFPRK